MRTTTYTCDRCGKTVEAMRELHPIHLGIGNHGDRVTEWCRDCLVSTGMVKWVADVKPPDPPPTIAEQLEELLRVIAQEEIQDRTGA